MGEHKGQFKVGEVNNPKGRPVGSENKLNSSLKRKIQNILDQIDNPRIKKVVTDAKSGDILAFLSRLAPKDLTITHEGEIKVKEEYDLKKLSPEQRKALKKLLD